MVGPFIFFDQMGPAEFLTGQGIDVRPHPHIGLATVTFLWSGAINHRDTLGSEQVIRPGDVNWMTAGRGIAHSERTQLLARRLQRFMREEIVPAEATYAAALTGNRDHQHWRQPPIMPTAVVSPADR